jgi:hypothetical protein
MFDHTVTISKELITLEHKYLDMYILETIKNKLVTTKVGKCTKEYGFIKDIEIKKDSIQPAEISMADASTRFSISYIIHSILPKPGKVYSSKSIVIINMDNIYGVIITVDDSCEDPFQIVMTNWTYKDNVYKFQECECTLPSTGHHKFVLNNIIVDTVEYRDKQFRVTGKHICKKKKINKEVNKEG